MSRLLTLKANKGARKSKKRLGRGNASGWGTYAGRGMNGQRSRTGSSARPGFEGGQTPLFRKMPKLKGFNNINRITFQVVNVSKLNIFEDGEEIEITKLYERNLISHKNKPVKILGEGELTKKLTVKVDRISSSAKTKIEKVKGTAIEIMKKEAKAEGHKGHEGQADPEIKPERENGTLKDAKKEEAKVSDKEEKAAAKSEPKIATP